MFLCHFGNNITNVSLKLKHSRKKTNMDLKGTLTVLPILQRPGKNIDAHRHNRIKQRRPRRRCLRVQLKQKIFV